MRRFRIVAVIGRRDIATDVSAETLNFDLTMNPFAAAGLPGAPRSAELMHSAAFIPKLT
jgi:hypothetical protein